MAGNKEVYQKAMNQGHSAAWDQDWEQASHFYTLALKEFPESPQALSSLGLAKFEMQDFESALKSYKRAATIAPEDPVPQEKIARIHERLGRTEDAIHASVQAAELHLKARSVDKAIENWIQVLILQPENIAIRSRLATVYERLGRKEEAVTEYISTASIFQHNGDLARAFKVAEYAQQVMPENQEVLLAIHMLRSNQFLPRPSRPKTANSPARAANVRQFEIAREEDNEGQPDPVSEAKQRALIDLAAQLFDQAEESSATDQPTASTRRGLNAFTKGAANPSSSTASGDRTRIVMHLGQAIDSQTQGEVAQTIVELEHALNLGFDHPSVFFILGSQLIDQDPDRSLRFLQQAVKNSQYSLASYLLIGQIHESNHRSIEAASAYLQALALADTQTVPPEQADELNQLYDPIIDLQSGPTDESELQRICEIIRGQLLRPNWSDYLLKARQQMPIQPEGSPPVPITEMVLEMHAAQVVETMAQVRTLAQNGKLRSAEEEALYALQFAPTYLPLHILIGELLLQQDRIEDAVTKFIVIADLYTVRGEISRAVRTLKRVSQLVPMDLNIRQRLINLLTSEGSIEEALKEYQSLAELYYRLAELDKARQTYLDALKVAAKSKDNRNWGVTLLLNVADIDLQRLNLRQALRIYEQIRTIQPDDPSIRSQLVALNYRLGQEAVAVKELDAYITFLENNRRRSDAIQFINSLLIDHGTRLELRRRLADLYVRNNQVPEAVVQLDAAADILLNQNKHLEAINMIETIIQLNPPNVQEYRVALADLRRDMLRK